MYIEIDLYCKHCGNKLKARRTGSRPLFGIQWLRVPVLEFIHVKSRKKPCRPSLRDAAPPSPWAAIAAYNRTEK